MITFNVGIGSILGYKITNDEIRPQKYKKNNGWNVFDYLETGNERKKQKLGTKKYDKTRAVA